MHLKLDNIKLVTAQSLAPGALFRMVGHHELGPLCMRAKFNDEEAYVLLDGEGRFCVKELHASVHAVPIGTHSLHIELGAVQPERTDEWSPGSLVVCESDVRVTVHLKGYAGTSRTHWLNLLSGMLDEESARHYACATNWQLIDRDEHGMETVLCTAGEIG